MHATYIFHKDARGSLEHTHKSRAGYTDPRSDSQSYTDRTPLKH
jgi:hypothetical protein